MRTHVLLEPLHGFFLGHAVLGSDTALLTPLVADIEARAAQHHVEVHAVDANAGVVLDAQINVLLDAKAKVARLGEVALPQLVLTDLVEEDFTRA